MLSPSQSLLGDGASQLGRLCGFGEFGAKAPSEWFSGLGWTRNASILVTEVRTPAASCPAPLGRALFLCTRQLW